MPGTVLFCRALNDPIEKQSGQNVWLASGSSDYTIKLWPISNSLDNKNGSLVTLYGHTDTILCVIYIKERHELISSSYDTTLKQWDLCENIINSKKCLRTLYGHTDYANCLCQLDEKRIASGSVDKTIKIWCLISGNCLSTLMGHYSSVTCLIKQKSFIISGSSDGVVKVWDLTDHHEVRRIPTR